MTKRKQCAALALALTLTISMFGCEKDKETTQSSAVSQIKTSDSAQPSNVKVKEYKFPEFLNKIKSLDELSRKLYTSFDSTQYVAEVEEQPFEGYKCEKLLADLFFTYRDGRAVGLLDKSGNVVLEADEYTEITVVSNGILQLSYDKERNAPMQYMKYDSDGNLSDYKHKKFSADSLYTYESQADDSGTDAVYSLMFPDGKNVVSSDGSDKWDFVEKISADSIDTNKAYKGFYKLTKNGGIYYACFDDFYNYDIYEGAYAKVCVEVGGEYGECYLADHDDYNELVKMIDSFGNASYRTAPSKDPGLDFIQITLGLKENTKTEITISSDGYCLTDTIEAAEGEAVNKYFSYLDKEDFADLILWCEQVLAEEYQK
ncbi:hypothetical protein [Ruminococcus bicirculans (ex Wegman et al. 2014)]|uniref:hypothetical protein n=1 Tax=Ruminococcus bicirculans (ex Wegman et al. 2014) TaxID=1160721 RepID=UPI003FD76E48